MNITKEELTDLLQKSASLGAQQALENYSASLTDMLYSMQGLTPANLENCTGDAQMLEEDYPMAYSRPMVFMGTDDNGNARYKRVSGRTQDEANDAIVRAYVESGRIWEVAGSELIQQYLRRYGNAPVIESAMTKHSFADYAWSSYFAFKEKSWSKNTKVREKGAIKALCSFFDGRFIEDITYRDVQAFMDSEAEKGLSKSSIESKRKTLVQIFQFALDDGIKTVNSANPARNSRLANNGHESDGTIPLAFEEYRAIVNNVSQIKDSQTQLAVALLALTGMRREELLGLKWTDIDMRSKQIHIQRAIIYPSGAPEEAPTKSKAGDRYIPIDHKLDSILQAHWKDVGNVIHNANGDYLTESQTEKLLANIRTVTGLERIDCHVFRTTFATMMAASGLMPAKNLQIIMGHSNIKVTMDVYAKAEKTLIGANRNILSEMLAAADF